MNSDLYSTMNFQMAKKFQPPQLTGAVVTDGPDGPLLSFNQVPLHSEADPWAEAKELVVAAQKQMGTGEPTLAVVFGVGLGYHLQALRDAFPQIGLFVYEPIGEIRQSYLKHSVFNLAAGAAPFIISDWQKYEDALRHELTCHPEAKVLVIAPPAYKTLRPEAHATFQFYVKHEIMRRTVSQKTKKLTEESFLDNLAQNAGHLIGLPNILSLKGRLRPQPAFLVGSGPSLDESLNDLRAANLKGIIFAAASAVKPLLNRGIRPDVILVIESEDTSSYLELSPQEAEMLGDQAVLALASSCHPAHFELSGYQKAIFHLSAAEAQIFGNGTFLPQGGNAGSAALALAYIWGLNPLILVGQDQAMHGDKVHATGTPGTAAETGDDLFAVPGLGGQQVFTHSGLMASINWFAESARLMAKQANPPTLFNASARGAQVPGFTEVALRTLTTGFPELVEKADLQDLLAKSPLLVKKEVEGDLKQMAGIVGTLRRLARNQAPKVQNEIKQLSAVSKFLGRLLARGLEARNPAELVAALNKADLRLTTMLAGLLSSATK